METALEQRRCLGWIYDDNLIAVMLASDRWKDYHQPLASQNDTPWGLAVRLADLEGPFGRFMSAWSLIGTARVPSFAGKRRRVSPRARS